MLLVSLKISDKSKTNFVNKLISTKILSSSSVYPFFLLKIKSSKLKIFLSKESLVFLNLIKLLYRRHKDLPLKASDLHPRRLLARLQCRPQRWERLTAKNGRAPNHRSFQRGSFPRHRRAVGSRARGPCAQYRRSPAQGNRRLRDRRGHTRGYGTIQATYIRNRGSLATEVC